MQTPQPTCKSVSKECKQNWSEEATNLMSQVFFRFAVHSCGGFAYLSVWGHDWSNIGLLLIRAVRQVCSCFNQKKENSQQLTVNGSLPSSKNWNCCCWLVNITQTSTFPGYCKHWNAFGVNGIQVLPDATKMFSRKQRHFWRERAADPPRPAPSSQREYPASQWEHPDMLNVMEQAFFPSLSSFIAAGAAVPLILLEQRVLQRQSRWWSGLRQALGNLPSAAVGNGTCSRIPTGLPFERGSDNAANSHLALLYWGSKKKFKISLNDSRSSRTV